MMFSFFGWHFSACTEWKISNSEMNFSLEKLKPEGTTFAGNFKYFPSQIGTRAMLKCCGHSKFALDFVPSFKLGCIGTVEYDMSLHLSNCFLPGFLSLGRQICLFCVIRCQQVFRRRHEKAKLYYFVCTCRPFGVFRNRRIFPGSCSKKIALTLSSFGSVSMARWACNL